MARLTIAIKVIVKKDCVYSIFDKKTNKSPSINCRARSPGVRALPARELSRPTKIWDGEHMFPGALSAVHQSGRPGHRHAEGQPDGLPEAEGRRPGVAAHGRVLGAEVAADASLGDAADGPEAAEAAREPAKERPAERADNAVEERVRVRCRTYSLGPGDRVRRTRVRIPRRATRAPGRRIVLLQA